MPSYSQQGHGQGGQRSTKMSQRTACLLKKKELSQLVKDQLVYCQNLRQADVRGIIERNATEAGRLADAQGKVVELKADIRALNECAIVQRQRLDLVINNGATDAAAAERDKQQSGEGRGGDGGGAGPKGKGGRHEPFDVQAMERAFQKLGLADDMSQAVSAFTLLINMRDKVVTTLNHDLLTLKRSLDKEFGAAFDDVRALLRSEKNTHTIANSGQMVSPATRLTVELCTSFEVLVHAVQGLRTVKEGLDQTMVLKQLRLDNDRLSREVEEHVTELKRIHHTYRELQSPELALGLGNRQRRIIEEQLQDLNKLKGQVNVLLREQSLLLAENGRHKDALGEVTSLMAAKTSLYEREKAWLMPRVEAAQKRAQEVEETMKQLSLDMSLLSTVNKKAEDRNAELEALVAKMAEEGAEGTKGRARAQQYSETLAKVESLENELVRKTNMSIIAMAAREEAIKAYRGREELVRSNAATLKALEDRESKALASEMRSAGYYAETKAKLDKTLEERNALEQEVYTLKAQLDIKEEEGRAMTKRMHSVQDLERDNNDLALALRRTEGERDQARATSEEHRRHLEQWTDIIHRFQLNSEFNVPRLTPEERRERDLTDHEENNAGAVVVDPGAAAAATAAAAAATNKPD